MNQPGDDLSSVLSLPDDCLMEIFEYMDVDNLKQAFLVNKKWQELIIKNPKTMEKFKLKLVLTEDNDPLANFSDACNLTRKYRALKIETLSVRMFSFMYLMAVETMQTIGPQLRYLELKKCMFLINDASQANAFFASMPQLEELKVNGSVFLTTDEEMARSIEPVNMKKLKSIVMYQGFTSVVQFIKTTQVLSFKSSMNQITDIRLLEFICSQTNMEELAIQNDFSSFMMDSNPNQQLDLIKFPLKKLAIHKSPCFLGTANNVIEFVDKIAPTLQEIELGHISPFEKIAYAEIFKKCQKLQVLDIFIKFAPKTLKFYQKLIPNHSLKELFVQDYDAINEKALKGLIRNSPNLETLNIRGDDISKELLHFISINLRKLKQLFVGLPSGSLADINLPSLTTIVVRNSNNLAQDWTEICNAMPNIKSFAFNDDSARTLGSGDSTIKAVTENWKKLEVVNFLNVQMSDVELILKNCADIKSVITCGFPDDQKASGALQAIKKNGRRLVNRVTRKESLFYKNHKSLWDNSLGLNAAKSSFSVEDDSFNAAGEFIAGDVYEESDSGEDDEFVEEQDLAESSDDDEDYLYFGINPHDDQ